MTIKHTKDTVDLTMSNIDKITLYCPVYTDVEAVKVGGYGFDTYQYTSSKRHGQLYWLIL